MRRLGSAQLHSRTGRQLPTRALPPRGRLDRPDRPLPADELTGRTLKDNLRQVAEAEYRAALAAQDVTGEVEKVRQTIAETDVKITRYRAALDAGGDPALIAGWISEATTIEKPAQARLRLPEAPPQRMTGDQLDG
jgi:site-specific DNA recombinase